MKRMPPNTQHALTKLSNIEAKMVQTIQTAYDKYAVKSKKWLAHYEDRGGKVYCGAGCFACCDMPIRVSLAEALVTAQALDTGALKRMKLHAKAVQHNAKTASDEEEFVERHRQEISFCPLLDQKTGSCTQYDVRPTRCRDTFSAFPSFYCGAGNWESLSPREQRQYTKEVARTPGTDGEVHYIAPLEHMSEPIWQTASKAMRSAWGLEVWGDFWTLTTLASHRPFMGCIHQGNVRGALAEAKKLKLTHPMTLEILT